MICVQTQFKTGEQEGKAETSVQMLAVCVCFHTVEIHFGANGSSTDLPVFLTSGGPGCVCARARVRGCVCATESGLQC